MSGPLAGGDEASLEVGRGEIVGLLGANGAGKTTLIRILLGLLSATRGQVELFGTVPSRQGRRRLGYVSQGLGLHTDLTVTENVQFAATAFGTAATSITLPASVTDVRQRVVGDIGLGRQRQLAFACAIGRSPELLVVDEPPSGVDALARARLWDTIHEQADSGVGVLVTTHYMKEAQQCDRLVIMAQGRVVATGRLEDIIGEATAVEVTTDSSAGRILLDAHVRAEVHDVPATLEETMLAISRAQ